jgi:hypothetical protein
MAPVAAAPAPAKLPLARRLRRPETAAICLLAAAFIGIRLWNLTTFCLDSDEIFSLLCTRNNLGGLLHAVRVDVVHPPLSYVLLWLWVPIGGESLLWTRLLPFALSVLALGPVWIVFRQLALKTPARIVALALLAINDYQVFHARYVRMYALLFLLSSASTAAFNALLAGVTRRRVVRLAAINLPLVYTHYYGWMVVAVEGLYLLLTDRRKLKPFALGTAAIGLLFLPWAIAAMQAATAKGGLTANLGWIRHPKIGDLWWYYAGCNGPLWPVPAASAMILFLSGALAAGLWRVFRETKGAVEISRLRFTALLAIFPPAATYLLSNVMRNSVWGNRHLIVSGVPYLALLGAALIALRPKWVRLAVISIAASWGIWGAYRVTLRPEPRNNLDVLTGQLVEMNARAGSKSDRATVYFLDPYLSFPMRYYLESHYERKWNLVDVSDAAAISGARVWVAYNYKTWKQPQRPQDLLRGLGYQIGPGIWSADRWDRIAVFLAYKPQANEPAIDPAKRD